MDIPRIIEEEIIRHIGKQKVILLYGSRRMGKSTIEESIAKKNQADFRIINQQSYLDFITDS